MEKPGANVFALFGEQSRSHIDTCGDAGKHRKDQQGEFGNHGIQPFYNLVEGYKLGVLDAERVDGRFERGRITRMQGVEPRAFAR